MAAKQSRSAQSRAGKSRSNRNRNHGSAAKGHQIGLSEARDSVAGNALMAQIAVPPPTITFVEYQDLTEIYVNGGLWRGVESVVADETYKAIVRQFEALGAARVVVVDHTTLRRF